ncbi:MAG: HAD family hydrolase [Halanaerobiales bacterium]
MKKLEAVIFDMDGVIIDSEPIHYQVNKELYDELEIEVTDDEYNNFIGVSNLDHWNYLKERYNIAESVEELIARQTNQNIEHLQGFSEEPIIGVMQLLEDLELENIRIGLASSSSLRYIKSVLEKFGIDDYFSVMVSGEDVERGKPHPDIFQETARKLKVDPENCVVIEDSQNGVRAAKEAQMKCVGFLNENSGNQDLSLADKLVDSMKKVTVDMLKKL